MTVVFCLSFVKYSKDQTSIQILMNSVYLRHIFGLEFHFFLHNLKCMDSYITKNDKITISYKSNVLILMKFTLYVASMNPDKTNWSSSLQKRRLVSYQ